MIQRDSKRTQSIHLFYICSRIALQESDIQISNLTNAEEISAPVFELTKSITFWRHTTLPLKIITMSQENRMASDEEVNRLWITIEAAAEYHGYLQSKLNNIFQDPGLQDATVSVK